MRPVAEVQIFDFITLMMDMIVNQSAKFRFMLGGKPTVPLVIRGPQGGGIRLAAQHSQSLETWFTQVPGLVVLAPSSPYGDRARRLEALELRRRGRGDGGREKAIDWLDAPIVRVGARDAPMPYNDKLERLVIASPDDIVEAVKSVVPRDKAGALA
jgi:pyruvate/2-oxoglutarate/acetoin dehydrogenase E1 component